MKKLILFLFFVCLLFCLIVVCDYRIAYSDHQKSIDYHCKKSENYELCKKNLIHNEKFKYNLKIMSFDSIWMDLKEKDDFNSHRRKIICEGEHCKKPIIVFGCSCAAGSKLKNEETFSYKLANVSKRTVYDAAFSGFGISQMLYQTKQPLFYENKSLEPTPEYAIYIYMPHHLSRMYESDFGINKVFLRYGINKNNELVERKSVLFQLNRFHLGQRYIMRYIIPNILKDKNNDKNFSLIKLYFETARKELQKRYPEIKFIILKYPYLVPFGGPDVANMYVYDTPRWKELEDEGFIIIDLNKYFEKGDIFTDKYIFPDGHPKTATWDVVVEGLCRNLNL